MVFTAGNFTALVHALGLAQGNFKPSPSSSARSGYLPASKNDTQTPGINPATPPSAYSHLRTSVVQDSVAKCTVQPYQAPDLGHLSFAPFDPAKATVFRYRQQQSVNLGSWFVHEQWMTPSLFDCAAAPQIAEFDIASGWGSLDSARAVLERHWDTFVDASDFRYLASIGINTVRLPIGYWNLGPDFCQGTPFEPVSSVYQNSWSRVVNAVKMAAAVGIGVLVDLHGAPGSQNGQPHSGISDGQVNLFGNDWFENKTLDVLTFLGQQFVNVTNVVGIQILNEPQDVDELPSFYTRAISTMRQISSSSVTLPLYIHDGFNLTQFSGFVANTSDFIVQDHHSYFVFTPSDESETASDHVVDVRSSVADQLATASAQARRNLVVDEFSCALTDESLADESDPVAIRKAFCQDQMELYQNETAGWAFWAYNKEDCADDPGWCFKAAVGTSLPSTFFSYGKAPPAASARIPALVDMIAGMSSPPAFDMSSASQKATNEPQSPMGPDTSSPVPGGVDPTQQRSRTPLPIDPHQRAISKGYSDGFLTAKIFALFGMSKLGFTGQYISDSMERLGTRIIEPGSEHYYQQWFLEGLNDGEALITSHVDQTYM